MGQSPLRVRRILAALAAAAMLAGIVVGVAQTPAVAAVTAVKGSACGYIAHVGLFGGPQAKLGCDPQVGTPSIPATASSHSPTATLNPDGSNSPQSPTTNPALYDADGASGKFGPAVIMGGRWPDNVASAPPTGPISVRTEGTPAGGVVTSSADIMLHPAPGIPVGCYNSSPPCYAPGGFGPFPVEGDSLHVECRATESGVTGSTTFVNATLATTTNGDGEPVAQEAVPDNPPINYTRSGVISNVGDVFTVVYNEQIRGTDGSLTVNAAHMYLFGPTAVGEVIKGQAVCGTTPSSAPPADTVSPTCGIPVIKPLGPEDPTPATPRQELVGVFDAGGIASISNIQITNGTVDVDTRYVPGSRNFSGATTAGSAVVTSSTANFSPADVNSTLSGVGIPAGAKILTYNSPTSVTLSVNATATSSSTSLALRRTSPFSPPYTGPIPVSATRTDELQPMTWSFDVTDAASNTTHCQGILPARISGFFPGAGPTAGGNQVVITGTGFTNAVGVLFGSNSATGVVVNSDTQITATAPAGSGTQNVTVVIPTGNLVATNGYTYRAAPTVTGVSPTFGGRRQSVTITGSGFAGATGASFGSKPAIAMIVNSDTQITAVAPGGSGVVDVTVKGAGGTSATSASDRFTLVPPADLNADGKADVAVYRPSNNVWYRQGQSPEAIPWGATGDIPVPADYTGDGKVDIAVFRPSTGTWFVQGLVPDSINFGTNGDVPVPADYSGDGTTDIAVYRPSTGTWFFRGFSPDAIGWGTSGDIPVPADYNGDGVTDLGVYRPSNGIWYLRGQTPEAIAYGTSGDIPLPADYDGDGRAEAAVFRPSNGLWFFRGLDAVAWGVSGDIPVASDYDGNGSIDIAVFRPSSGTWFRRGVIPEAVNYGTTGDKPVELTPAIRMNFFL